jgi:hypothetical protein
MKHASDVYTSIDQFGNIELAHPSGMFLRTRTSQAHEWLLMAQLLSMDPLLLMAVMLPLTVSV